MLGEYKGDKFELSRPERFIYELFQIPDVRSKLLTLIFCLEFPVKLEEALDNTSKVKKGLQELKSDKIKRLMEIALAVGVYINNPRNNIYGFKFSSILKLADVKAKGSKQSLLHFIAKMIENNHPDLLEWTEDLKYVKEAIGAVAASQQDISYMKSGASTMKKELESMGDHPETAKLKAFFNEHVERVTKEIEGLDLEQQRIVEEVSYFGEQSSDIPGFFKIWIEFANAFRSAVKFNKAQAKKEAALKAKEDAKRAKEEEDKVMSKVVTTLRKSQANLQQMYKGDDVKIEGFFSKKGRDSKDSRRDSRRESRKPDDQAVDSLVDDILSNNPAFTSNRPRRSMRDDNGVVKQLAKGLRDSRTFSKIREKRTDDKPEKETRDRSSTKQALQRQISTKLPRYNK